MLPDPHRFFSDDDREAIRAAAVAAERRTGGEIVPYVVGSSDRYPETHSRGALAGALLAAGVTEAVHDLGSFWGGSFWLWLVVPVVVGALVGWLLSLIPPVRRFLISPKDLERRVALRAAEAFVAEEVFNTRDRTGVLLFVSLFEHRVLVLADEGVNAKVEPGAWQDIADAVALGIKNGTGPQAMVDAIGSCGGLLEECGVVLRPDDEDELSNELRIGDA